MPASSESEVIAQALSAISGRVAAIEARLGDIDKVIAGLEGAALTTARALQEISRNWDAVYDAMRRPEDPDVGQLADEPGVGQLRGGLAGSRPRKRKR